MKERPIPFSGPMVRAILAGQKTQTRRVAKGVVACHARTGEALANIDSAGPRVRCPYGRPGDRLWVRETWAKTQVLGLPWPQTMIVYREGDNRTDYGGPWKPGRYMPRAASRITLEVTGVRVERLQDISEADAIAEGLRRTAGGSWLPGPCDHPEWAYHQLWDQINGPGAWDANPWVWVVEFKRLVSCAS